MAAALVLAAITHAARAEPYLPADGSELVERLPAGQRPLAALPTDQASALVQAKAYLSLAERAADPRFAGLARGVLAPWWSTPEPNVDLALVRSRAKRALHDFEGARADLEAAISRFRSDPRLYLDHATLLTVMGYLDEAESSCFRLERLRPGILAEACMASVQSLRGGGVYHDGALQAALASSQGLDEDTEIWARSILADIALRLGDEATAEARYRGVLQRRPQDVYALTALADFLLAQHRDAELPQLIDGATTNPAHLLRLLLAEMRLSLPQVAAHRQRLADILEQQRRRGDQVHLRDAARFALDVEGDAESALDLALRNWSRQRQTADASMVIESALAARKPEAAAPVIDWLEASGVRDASIAALLAAWHQAARPPS